MSFNATLTIEGKSFNLLQYTHTLKQKSERGKVTSGVRGGTITLIIDGTEDELLGSWATGPTAKKNGEIIFDRVDQKSTLQKLEFEDAYALFYFELMSANPISDINPILEICDEIYNFDLTEEDIYQQRINDNTQRILRFAERTRISNCILMRITAAKIKLDGIDHKNT